MLHRNRGFLLLWGGYFISAFGDNFNDLGQLKMLEAMEGEATIRLMALMLCGLFLPYIVLGPVAGWLADRVSRKWTMVVADTGRAMIVLSFAVVIPVLHDRWGFGDYTVMVTQMMLGTLAAFFSPARQAMVPMLVRPDQLMRANGMISAIAPIGAMIGFLTGGYLVDHYGATWNFRVNCGTYLISAILISLILLPRRPEHTIVDRPKDTLFGPLLEGIRYANQHRRVWQMIALGGLFWGAAGVVYSCVPAVVKAMVEGHTYTDIGHYRALPAIGMIIGAGLMTAIGSHISIRTAIIIGLLLTTLGLGILTVVVALNAGSIAAAVTLASVGSGGAILLVTVNATLQRLVPNDRRGRIFGLNDVATMGAMVFATGLLGLSPIKDIDLYIPWILGLTTATLLVAWLVTLWVYATDKRRPLHPYPTPRE